MRGVIDFSKARIRDVGWWRRCNILLDAMVEEDDLKALQAAYAFQCALVGNGMLKDDSFKAAQQQSQAIFREILNILKPWSAQTLQDVKASEIENLVETYKRLVGDPSDPVFQKRLQEAIDILNQRGQQNTQESEDDRVSRLLRERTVRRTKNNK